MVEARNVAKDRKKALDDFLRDDYHLKVQYLTDQFTRMWNRFQFMLGLETVVVGLYFAPLGGARVSSALAFSLLGLVVSIAWYIMGAEDRFLVRLYRAELATAAAKAAETVGIERFTYAGDVGLAEHYGRKFAYKNLSIVIRSPIEWRSESISITHLAAALPLVVVVLWVGLLTAAVSSAVSSR